MPLLRGQTRREIPVSLAESWYPRLHFGWSELRSARVGEWKYIAAPRPELYDLRVDRMETRNVAGDRAAVAARLAADLSRIAARFTPPGGTAADAPTAQPDAATIERLQALGLCRGVCAGDGGERPPGTRPIASRTTARYRDLFNRALGALGRGRPADAALLLQRLVKTERARVRSAPLSGERVRRPEAFRPRARRVRRRVAVESIAVDAALRGGEGVVVQRRTRGGGRPRPARPGAGAAVVLRPLHARRDSSACRTLGGGGRRVYARHRAQRPRPPGAREPRGGRHAPRQPRPGAHGSPSA